MPSFLHFFCSGAWGVEGRELKPGARKRGPESEDPKPEAQARGREPKKQWAG